MEPIYVNIINNKKDEIGFLVNEGTKATRELLTKYNTSYQSKLEMSDALDQYYLFKNIFSVKITWYGSTYIFKL